MDKVKIGFPIEYEYGGIIYDGLFLRESEIKELEKRLKEINKITDLEQQCKKQKEVIDKAIEKINDYKIYCEKNKGFTEYTDIEIEAIEPVISKLEDILKEVSE